MEFFKEEESILYGGNADVKRITATISNRYMSDNPSSPFIYRAFSDDSFLCADDSRYIIDFNAKFPGADDGVFAFAFSKIRSAGQGSYPLSISAKSPVWIYINGDLVYSTRNDDEVSDLKRIVDIDLNNGWNSVFVKCQKNTLGFGCTLGSYNSKWRPLCFYAPFNENEGGVGWRYTGVYDYDIFKLSNFPRSDAEQKAQPVAWYPKVAETTNGTADFSRVFGSEAEGFAYAVTHFTNYGAKDTFEFSGSSAGLAEVYVDGASLGAVEGKFRLSAELQNGTHYITVEAKSNGKISLNISCGNRMQELLNSLRVCGTQGEWLYAGMFNNRQNDITREFEAHRLLNAVGGETYWRVDANTFARPVLENDVFGRWSYPVGVVMYGLLQTSRYFGNAQIMEYARSHIMTTAKMQRYALWDKEKFGHALINHQMQSVDALDDCGSFGSAMLDCVKEGRDKDAEWVADSIADYMENKQERREDGAFYRDMPGHSFNNTMWADDLYMSVPFLCRYYQLSGDEKYIDDAARQFLLYKKYLYMEREGLFSHTYSFNHSRQTEVPWGRGNGWVFFSLSELLEVMPHHHKDRQPLVEFFGEICESIIKYQDETGRWHQVLNDPESYPETSCTAMFIYALSRGVRFGWLKDMKFVERAMRGWTGMVKNAVDKNGNIYGVCVGSGFSFRKDYYKNELRWNINDTHGTGIVLLACVEILKLIDGG